MRGLDDLHYEDSMFAKQEEAEEDYEPEVEEEAEEVDDPMETQSSVKTQSRSRTHNYCQEEDIALCHAWMNVSLDASVGTDQSKEKFWGRIEEYYNTIMEVPSSRTQGSLGHRWGNILEQCNRWSSCIDQVNHAPPSGVQISAYGPIIQELYKQRNKNGGKGFTLHHCYKELANNEKWIRTNSKTTPKRSRISISVEADDEEDENPNKRPDGNKIAKEREKRGAFGGTYKEELVAMIEAKKALVAERKEEKATRWNELKSLEDEKWRSKLAAEERKLKVEERRLALEEERLVKEKKAEECAIMFMNLTTMDAMAKNIGSSIV